MNLAAFTSNLLSQITEFTKYWEENHKKNPEEFPAEMNQAEWEEQMVMWYDTHADKYDG